ncbi:MAG: hypothetical protein D6759_07075 [Chloroflexi bacterium]|nr:MAG: hypothetical protein D6759_07075 [Chloroflexota bacterium]
MRPATTLEEAYLAFDPGPLRGPALKAYYVDRPHNPSAEMRQILLTAPDEPHKLLFTGHRGSGKSTELNLLAEDAEIQQAFLLVPFGLEEILDPLDLHFLDILVAMEAKIYLAGREAGLSWPEELVRILADFWVPQGRKAGFLQEDETTSLSERLTGGFRHLVGPYGRLRLEPLTRQILRENLAGRVSELITHLLWLVGTVRSSLNRGVLIIIDDLDKPDLATARALFYERGTTLTQPPCKIVYTVPIALFYTGEFRTITRYFTARFVHPNINVQTRGGKPYPPGIKTMHQVVYRRMNQELIAPDALDYLVRMSGGMMRELTTLMRTSCNKARVAGKWRISLQEAKEAVDEVQRDYERILHRKEHYVLLRQVAREKRIRDVHTEGDETNILMELLHNLSILEYRNEESWWDVHPIVARLL